MLTRLCFSLSLSLSLCRTISIEYTCLKSVPFFHALFTAKKNRIGFGRLVGTIDNKKIGTNRKKIHTQLNLMANRCMNESNDLDTVDVK